MSHGIVKLRADGIVARCLGPGFCPVCNKELADELNRLRLLAPKDTHQLCHDLKGVDVEAFCRGCRDYQVKLYGHSPIDTLYDNLKACRKVLGQLKAALEEIHYEDKKGDRSTWNPDYPQEVSLLMKDIWAIIDLDKKLNPSKSAT